MNNLDFNQQTTLLSKTPARMHFFFGCILGGIIFILIYGVSLLRFTNIDWLTHSVDNEGLWDLTQHYLGWVYYRNSDWHFPIGLVDNLYSSPVSIVYTDSIPLFAFIFKLLSPILPETFQYFGLFGLLCYMLTGGFAAFISKKYSNSFLFSGIAAILFCISPVLTKRMFYHTALSAHFLILIAICLWLYKSTLSMKKFRFYWSLLLVVSALINAYYVPMVLGILLCSCLQDVLVSKNKTQSLISTLISVGIPCLSMGIACYLFGFFYGDVKASTVGLEKLSFNLLQLINPMNYLCDVRDYNYSFTPQSYSSLLPNLPLISGWQEEGFSYLGLGMIILVLVSILFGMKSLWKKKALWIPLGVGAVVFTALALSPTITFGSKTLLHLSYPMAIYSALSIFRSTGRFIWPVYYGLFSLTILFFAKEYQRKKGKGILFVLLFCTALQVFDLWPSLVYKHDAYQQDFSAYTEELQDEGWDILGENASQIMFYPPTEFGIECDPKTSCIFEMYALKYHLSLNVTYMSRDMSFFADAKTLAHFENRKDGETHPDIIYVFFKISDIPDAAISHLNYYEMDGYIVGTEQTLKNCKAYTP